MSPFLFQFLSFQRFQRILSFGLLFLVLSAELLVAKADTANLQVTVLPALEEVSHQSIGLSIANHSISVGTGLRNRGSEPKNQEIFPEVMEQEMPDLVEEAVVEEENLLSTTNDLEEIIDVPSLDYHGHWAESYIQKVKELEFAQGRDEEGNFEPNSAITRAEFLKMSMNAMGYEISDSLRETHFVDVAEDDWYASYVYVASSLGLVEGYEGNRFEPNSAISRAEALKLLMLGVMDVQFELEENENVLERFAMIRAPFVDLSVEDWYAPYILYSTELGLVEGYEDYTFRPSDSMTRAELSKLLIEALEFKRESRNEDSGFESLQLSEEGLEFGTGAAVDSNHDIGLWKRIRSWSLQKTFWR